MKIFFLAGCVFLGLTTCSFAQHGSFSIRPASASFPFASGNVVHHHSSTAAEGMLHGFADVFRAQGERNLLNSKAAINLTEARRQEIENRAKWTKTFFEMRAMNRQYRSKERGSRPSKEDYIRFAKQNAPSRLALPDLDPITGKITWPMFLGAPQFDQDREQLERLFADRAEKGVVNFEEYQEIEKLTDKMKKKLHEQIWDISLHYMPAKNFLNSLAYEALFPAN